MGTVDVENAQATLKFPVFFPVNGNFGPETGSLVTGPTAIQSAPAEIVL